MARKIEMALMAIDLSEIWYRIIEICDCLACYL